MAKGDPSKGEPLCRIRAGEAFMRMAEGDPAAREALRRYQEHVRAAVSAIS